MHFSTLKGACLAAVLAKMTSASWSLKKSYDTSNFFSEFSFFTSPDPTHGFVQYVSESTAQGAGFLTQNSTAAKWGVDHTSSSSGGREAVRLTSSDQYSIGSLFILDVEHMPVGCGTWPAYWLVGPNWPNGGEVDIIEGVNSDTTNKATLHTAPGCTIGSSGSMTGTVSSTDCNADLSGNTGCGITTTDSKTYGAGLNAIGGGVYATSWQTTGIQVWFFPRGSIPSDITSGSPNPTGWSKPLASFGGGTCDYSSKFSDMNIVFDTTFCGDWAGSSSVWSGDATCGKLASSCNSYVQNNPSAFANAYWEVNSLKVYTGSGAGAVPPTNSVSSGGKSSSAAISVGSSATLKQSAGGSSATGHHASQTSVLASVPASVPASQPTAAPGAPSVVYTTDTIAITEYAPAPAQSGQPPNGGWWGQGGHSHGNGKRNHARQLVRDMDHM